MTFAPFDVSKLVKDISHFGSLVAQHNDEDARQKCLAAARTLSCALETPMDSTVRLIYADVRLKLFQLPLWKS